MDDKRDIIEELKGFKDQFTLNSNDTKKAEHIAEELYGNKNPSDGDIKEGGALVVARKRNIIIIIAAFFVVCAIFLSIFLPIMLNKEQGSGIKYYDLSQIETEIIDNIDEFIVDNNLTCRYYKGDSFISNYKAGYIKENKQLVFLVQQSVAMDTSGFDTIVLNIVLTKDKFQAFENFEKFTDVLVIDGVTVQYKTEMTGQTSKIYASFEDSSVIYYLQISTSSDVSAEEKLNHYIPSII